MKTLDSGTIRVTVEVNGNSHAPHDHVSIAPGVLGSLSLREIELEELRQPGFSLSLSAYASKQVARRHSPAVVLKARARSLPTKILDILKYGHIQSQGCKSAKQQGLAPRIVKRFGQ